MSSSFFNNTICNNIIKQHLEVEADIISDMFYSYGILSKNDSNNISVINNHPEYFDLYVKNKYHLIDPITMTALRRVAPFQWDKNITTPSGLYLPEIFTIAMDYNIEHGLSLVTHDECNNVAVLSVMTDSRKHRKLKSIINKNGDYLQGILINTHQKMLSAYKEINRKSKNPGLLSSREKEIIRMACSDKNHSEIAKALMISQPTVKYYMRNIVRKIGATDIRHAIMLCKQTELTGLN